MWHLSTETPEKLGNLIVPDSVQKARFAQTIDKITNLDFQQFMTNMISDAIWVLLKIVLALAIYFVGRWFIKRILRVMDELFEKRHVDTSLRTFLRNLVKVVFYVLLILTIVQMLGINTTSIIALLASAGLAVGMALSGTMQNFAGGVMILMLKPYRVGDYISAQGQSGTVQEIMLFSTRLTTPDNQTIYIPNGSISTSIIDNYSAAQTRRVEWVIGISYGDDYDVAKQTILELLARDKRVNQTPAPDVWLSALGDSAVNVTVRVWTANSDFWGVFYDLNEQFYKVLPTRGIHFPFPQLDVHLTASGEEKPDEAKNN